MNFLAHMRCVTLKLPRANGVTGACVGAILFALALASAKPWTLADTNLEQVRSFAQQSYFWPLAGFSAFLLVLAMIFCAVLGTWAGWVTRNQRLLSWLAFFLALVAFDARAMATYPQIFAPAFHAQGGWLAALQAAVTALPHPNLALLPILLWTLVTLARVVRRSPTYRSPSQPVVASLLGLVVATLIPIVGASSSCGAAEPRTSTTRKQPNILILAADSLRQDYLTPERTPHLAALRSRSAVWSQMFVHTPRTFPSWSEILSARFAPATRIRHMFPTREERRFEELSLVNSFRQHNYRTFVAADYAGDIFARMPAGFETVLAPNFDLLALAEEQILRTQLWLFGALAWQPMRTVLPLLRGLSDLADPAWLATDAERLIASADDRPFFGVVFFSVAHFPYAAPHPFFKAEAAPRYQGPFRYGKPPSVNEAPLSETDVHQVRALYAGAVRAFDTQVGRLLDFLERQNLTQNTILVITADHGENLYERSGDAGHGDHLFGNESLRVPFILYDPTGHLKPGERAGLAQTVDILPTLLDLAGLPLPSGVAGQSLRRGTPRDYVFAESGLWFADTNRTLLQDRRIAYPDILQIGEVEKDSGHIVLQTRTRALVLTAKHHMVFDGHWKLVAIPTMQGLRWEWVDCDGDPWEAHSISVALATPEPFQLARLVAEPRLAALQPMPELAGLQRLRTLQHKLYEHAYAEGSTVSSAGWILPGDGRWAP